jgi:nucleotide-binding universal stress UspA family protein
VLHKQVAEALAEEAKRQAADLIVMVHRDRPGLGGWLHRSVADSVLAATSVPLLLLHSISALPSPVFSPGLRLIVALDDSLFAEAALPVAHRFAALLGAPIRLVRVVSQEAILSAPIVAADGRPITTLDGSAALLSARARDDLAKIGAGLGLDSGQIECDVRFGTPADVLPAVAAEYAPALIIMATHGYSGLRRSAVGSVAADILRAGSPALLVHPPEHTGPSSTQWSADEASAEPRS